MQLFVNEYELIRLCVSGDGRSQERLYQLYAKKMFGVCMRYANCPDKAADLLQDGFIKVFQSLPLYKHEGSFEGWIKRIIVNTAIDGYRKNNVLHKASEYDSNHADSQANEAMSKLHVQDIMNCVQNLSDGYRTVFNLYVVEGFSHAEIADMLGIAVGTSKSQLARAKSILKAMIVAQSAIRLNKNYNE